MFDLFILHRNFKLNLNKYCDIRIKRRLSLLILLIFNIIYFEIDIIVE